ncbi:ExeM/NucH family extracellular endonuclease [Bacterioplanoides sp.]|uniref:ExeM/NucH family extracellular endonuclease n=1 Tax=Bacterioplanoides sp. TaxID=2066072 RepID=UPI003B5A7C25
MRNKLTTAIMLAAGAVALPAQADISDIIISEYVEGSSNNKAIELSNTGSTAHTFDASVSLYYNTGSHQNAIKKPDGSNILEGLTIAPGKSLVLLNGQADRATIEPFILENGGTLQVAGTFSEVSHSAMNFNGNDSVFIGTDASTPLDLIGIPGTYDGWPGKDKTLRRTAGSTPSTSYVASEWTTFDRNTFDGLGAPGAATSTPSADINDIIISEYVEGSGNNKAIELTNTGSLPFTFDNSVSLYYNNGRFQNQIQKPDGSNILEGLTIAGKKTLVLLNGEADRAAIEPFITINGGAVQLAGTFSEVSHSAMNFNGDDSVFIGTDSSTPLDLVGIPGTTDGWEGEDRTLRRAADAAQSTTFVSEQWTALPQNTFNGLGGTGNTTAELPATACTGNADVTKVTVVEIQGAGFRSPLLDGIDGFETESKYRVSGIVTHVTDAEDSLNNWKGVYIQDVNAPADRSASDGILVDYKGDAVKVGQQVCFLGKVKENFNRTQFVAEGNAEVENSNTVTPRVTDLAVIPSDYVCADGKETCADDAPKRLDAGRLYERHEGMLVKLPEDIDSSVNEKQTMRVTRTFGFDFSAFRNNMALSYERVNLHPNQKHAAGSDAAKTQNSENKARLLVVESEIKAENGDIPYYPAFKSDPNNNEILVDDSVVGMQGFIDYSFSQYRIIPTENVTSSNFIHNIGRTSKPELKVELASNEFELKVASANVLNYFNSPFGGDRNNFGSNRGASLEVEFNRQRAKLTEALYRLDADILGLMEVENNGFSRDGALGQIVADINQKYLRIDYSGRNRDDSVTNRYNMVGIDTDGNLEIDQYDTIGTDVITNALIYRPSKVSLKSVDIIEMPNQQAKNIVDEKTGQVLTDSAGRLLSSGSARQRNTVVATFIVNNTGKELTVAVNHFKSKGSNCIDDWQNTAKAGEAVKYEVVDTDFQGQCEHFRNATALYLGQEMAKYPGDKIILGDLNAYGQEEPTLILTEIPAGQTIRTAGDTFIGNRPQFGSSNKGVELTKGFGYINAVKKQDELNSRSSFSFSFSETLGSLDHILVSPSLNNRIKDAIDWNINSIESTLFDYSEQRRSSSRGTLSYNKGPDEVPVSAGSSQKRDVTPEENAENALRFHKKSDGTVDLTHYRTSDHDPVIVSLAYKYLEAGNNVRRFVINSSRIELPYVTADTALTGDVVKVEVSAKDHQDTTGVSIPTPALSKDGAQSVMVEINGLENGRYEFRQYTTRDGAVVAGSEMKFEAIVSRTDSVTPQIVTPEYDGSGGGGHMAWWMLALAGLMLGRRNAKA